MNVFCFTRRFALTVVLISSLCVTSFADFNASSYVSNFNASNSGQGYRFTYAYNNEVQLTQAAGTDAFDLSGYNTSLNTGGTNYFRTFCNEPNQGVGSVYKGSLNYNTSTGVTRNSNGYAVKLGTAVLYSQFASGTLNNYGYEASTRSADSSLLRVALQATMGITVVSDWSSNKFLSQLLTINSSQSYWSSAYDPNNYYAEVGDYAVFAMNVYSSTGTAQQDFFFVTSTDGGGDGVPEPATLLLWSIGGLSLAGASWRKRRIAKK